MNSRKIEYLPLDEIKPAVRNPKRHGVDGIRASISRFGFATPALRDERTGRLVAGHGRLAALTSMRDAGEDPPAGVRVDAGRWLVPVICGWASRSDAEAEAYLVADNRHTELGGWDDEELAALLASVGEVDPDLVAIAGYDDDDLATLLGGAGSGGPAPGLTDPDDVPEPPAEPVSKPGDLWLLGNHRVLCGDATQPDDVGRLLGGITPDVLLADPPYCSGGFQEAGRSAGSIGSDAKIKRTIANDRLSTRGYMALMKAALGRADTPIAYVFTDWRMWVNLFDVAESSGYGVRNMIVWNKETPGMGQGWRAQHELVMLATKATVKWDAHKALGNVISLGRTGNPLHPTQKPVELLGAILHITDMATTVYDPFAGSGSTLIAAHLAGRVAYLLDLDPVHVDTMCRRFQEHTGEKPILAATGQSHDFTVTG